VADVPHGDEPLYCRRGGTNARGHKWQARYATWPSGHHETINDGSRHRMAAPRRFYLPAGSAIISTHVPNIVLQRLETGSGRSNLKQYNPPPHHCTAKSRVRDDSSLIGLNNTVNRAPRNRIAEGFPLRYTWLHVGPVEDTA